MANLQRGFGAALGTFARVLAGQQDQRARAEERERERSDREKQAQQQESQRLIGLASNQQSLSGLSAVQAQADAIGQGEQMRPQIDQARARVEPIERERNFDLGVQVLQRGGTLEQALEAIRQPEGGQAPAQDVAPVSQEMIGQLAKVEGAPKLDAMRQEQADVEAEAETERQAMLSVMPQADTAQAAIDQFRLTVGRDPTDEETEEITQSFANFESRKRVEEDRRFGAVMQEVETGRIRDLDTAQKIFGAEFNENQVKHFERATNIALEGSGPVLPSRVDITAIEDQAIQEVNFLQQAGEPLPVNPRTGEEFEDIGPARNFLARQRLMETFGSDVPIPSSLLDRSEMEWEEQRIAAIGDVAKINQLIAMLESPNVRAQFSLRGVPVASLRASLETQKLQVESGAFTRAIQEAREKALAKERERRERATRLGKSFQPGRMR